MDFESLKITPMTAAANSHFYRHGYYSFDRQHLFTTENDFNQVRGLIGIRDASTLQQLGKYPSYGTGPHDLQLMPDGKTWVIAIGGIQFTPILDDANLITLPCAPLWSTSITSGKNLAQYTLKDHQLSIRHLLVTAAGDVGVA